MKMYIDSEKRSVPDRARINLYLDLVHSFKANHLCNKCVCFTVMGLKWDSVRLHSILEGVGVSIPAWVDRLGIAGLLLGH